MRAIFVDTSAWFALSCHQDHDHPAIRDLFAMNRLPLLTTDYILDETITLLQARLNHAYAVRFLDRLVSSSLVQLIYLSPRQIQATMTLFRNRPDKNWSFTDGTSFVVMEEYQMEVALTLDKHFRQAGFPVKP
jgi:predicted nucleic acid-binding protein